MVATASSALAAIEARIDPHETLARLPVGQQQLVQIASAVSRGARVLVFDEPTSSLSRYESEHLFGLINRLKQAGVTIVYVTHRLGEVFRLCDQVTVLRDGRKVATLPVGGCTEDALVELMIGRPVDAYFPTHVETPPGEECLRIEHLTSRGLFEDISFAVRAGEIVGLAGLVGAGRTEVAETLFGLRVPGSGRVFVRGREALMHTPREAMRCGLGLVPEDRKRHGLVLSMNARENISLPVLERVSRCGWVRRGRERELVGRYFDRLRVRAPSVDAVAAGLSGGNQQKLVLAKWLAAKCDVLLLDEPTRGVDVGAKAEIHGLIDELASRGAGVLLISSELPEILNLCTRILVLRDGRIVGRLSRGEADQDALMRLMSGISRAPA